jgi:hypothetical protein
MKKLLCALILAASLPVQAADELTGEVKLACEAILCLSSGERPSECAPSINHFFSIVKKTVSKTTSARQDFLSLCPVVSEDSNVRDRVAQIARGAGRCDAAYLNLTNQEIITVRECPMTVRNASGRYVSEWVSVEPGNYWSCEDPVIREVVVIRANKPAYCSDYDSHEWSYLLQTHYVGNELSGGHWEDAR